MITQAAGGRMNEVYLKSKLDIIAFVKKELIPV